MRALEFVAVGVVVDVLGHVVRLRARGGSVRVGGGSMRNTRNLGSGMGNICGLGGGEGGNAGGNNSLGGVHVLSGSIRGECDNLGWSDLEDVDALRNNDAGGVSIIGGVGLMLCGLGCVVGLVVQASRRNLFGLASRLTLL